MSSGDSRNQRSNIVRERGVPLSEQMHTLRNIIKHQLWGSEPSARFSALPYSSQATRSDQCPSQSCRSFLAFSVKHEDYQWVWGSIWNLSHDWDSVLRSWKYYKNPASKVQYINSIFNVQILNFLLNIFSLVFHNVYLKYETLHAITSCEHIINIQWTQPDISWLQM